MKTNPPRIGDRLNVNGKPCEIFKVHPAGTIDVITLDGSRAYRISGLPLARTRQDAGGFGSIHNHQEQPI